jgi:hypothetical protein
MLLARRIAWDYTAVKANIDPAFALGSINLDVKVLYSGCWRNGVQWHVNYRSDTTKGSGPGTGPETFPFCAAGLVEMDMSIDKTRK